MGGREPMTTAENKALVRQHFDLFHNERQLGLAERILGSELLTPMLDVAAMVRTSFPDCRITLDDQVAEADMVAAVWTASGTHRGDRRVRSDEWPRRARAVTWTETTTLCIAEGKIAEVIGTNWAHLGILQLLGALPASDPR